VQRHVPARRVAATNRLELAGQTVLAGVTARIGELRDHDRGQDAEDDHHDQNFDERKALAVSTLSGH
jgi:hypothetical protein